jgi:hypothetical protein
MPWKVDLRRSHDGALSERLLTDNMAEADAWFRKLLAKGDLTGQRVAARVVSPITNATIYFSRFDDESRRIHPEAPLNLLREDDGTAEACQWRPTLTPDEEVAAAWQAMTDADNAFRDALTKAHGARLAPEFRYRRDMDTPEVHAASVAYNKACWAFHQAAERARRERKGD